MSKRLAVILPVALAATVGLFFIMRHLIATDFEPPEPTEPIVIVLYKPKVNDIQDYKRPQPEPPQPETPPKPPKVDPDPGGGTEITGTSIGPITFEPIDSEITVTTSECPSPIIRVAPAFPAGMDRPGSVLVRFTVTETGEVRDAAALESSNSRFEREAIRAVLRWKYKPCVKDGKPVATENVTVRIEFQIEG